MKLMFLGPKQLIIFYYLKWDPPNYISLSLTKPGSAPDGTIIFSELGSPKVLPVLGGSFLKTPSRAPPYTH